MVTKQNIAPDAFERDWTGVIENHERCRKAYQLAIDEDGTLRRESARAYWHSIGLILHCYNRPENWNGDTVWNGTSAPRFSFPPRLAKVLGDHADSLNVGEMPESVSHVISIGRAAAGPRERRNKEVAVAMVAAIKMGSIDGKIKDVANAYGVTVRALQKWCVEYEWVGSGTFGAPDALKALFAREAELHQIHGRSASAIAKRARSKRREPK